MNAVPRPLAIATPPTVKRKARLLVVDDDPGLLRLLTIRLRAENYDVEAVESAAGALAAATRFRPDLVISDLRMEPVDGIGLLKELQNRWPGLKSSSRTGTVRATARPMGPSAGSSTRPHRTRSRPCARSVMTRSPSSMPSPSSNAVRPTGPQPTREPIREFHNCPQGPHPGRR